MLEIFRSNSVEYLADQLIDRWTGSRRDVLAPIRVVIPNPEVGRWLSRRWAARAGVCANVHWLLPNAGVWLAMQTALGIEATNEAASDRLKLLLWNRFPDFAPKGVKSAWQQLAASARHDLVAGIAARFESYLLYRPELMTQWSLGKRSSDAWQTDLWQSILPDVAMDWPRLFQKVQTAESLESVDAFDLFCVPALPPTMIRLLPKVLHKSDHVAFQLSPTSIYWGDFYPLASTDLQQPLEHVQLISDHLLTRLGQGAREQFELWAEQGLHESDAYANASANKRLGKINDAMLEAGNYQMFDDGRAAGRPDRSIEIHATSGKRRELEVALDLILSAIDRHPDLKLHEVAVIAPNIDAYIGLIPLVFGSPDAPSYFAYRSLGASAPANSLLALIQAAQTSLGTNSWLALFEQPWLAKSAGLSAEVLGTWRQWLEESGAVNSHPIHKKFSFSAAVDRLVGIWLGGENTVLGSDIPMRLADCDNLGKLGLWLDWFNSTAEQGAKQSVERWSQWLLDRVSALQRLMQVPREELELLQQAMARLGNKANGTEAELEADEYIALLSADLGQLTSRVDGVAAGVTFATAASVRMLPWRILIVLDMAAGQFPGVVEQTEDDLLSAQPRMGDRGRHIDDRQLALEWLNCASDGLYFIYSDRTPAGESNAVPSPVIDALEDFIEPDKVPEFVHPILPSAADYVAGGELNTFQVRYKTDAIDQRFACPEIDVELDAMDFAQFRSLFTASAKTVLRNFYGLDLEMDVPEDALEPHEPDPLVHYRLLQDLTQGLLEGEPPDALLASLDGHPWLPAGVDESLWSSRLMARAQTLVQRVLAVSSGRQESAFHGTVNTDSMALNVSVDGLYGDQLIRWVTGKKISDSKIVAAKLDALMFARAGYAVRQGMVVNYTDQSIVSPIASSALEPLTQVAKALASGRQALLLGPALVYAKTLKRSADPHAAMEAARLQLSNNASGKGGRQTIHDQYQMWMVRHWDDVLAQIVWSAETVLPLLFSENAA